MSNLQNVDVFSYRKFNSPFEETMSKSMNVGLNSEDSNQLTQITQSIEMWRCMVQKNADSLKAGITDKLIYRFDMMYDSEVWDIEDIPVTRKSAQTSISLLKLLNPADPPKIGCDSDGNIIIYWGSGKEYARFTCFTDNKVKWFVSYFTGKKRVEANGRDYLEDISAKLGEHRKLFDSLKLLPI